MNRIVALALVASGLLVAVESQAKDRGINLTVKPTTSYLKTPSAPLKGTFARQDVDGRAGSITLEGYASGLPSNVTSQMSPQGGAGLKFPL